MSKHFMIDKGMREGTLVTEEGFVFKFDKKRKWVQIAGGFVNFQDLTAFLDSANAIAYALKDDIKKSIIEEQLEEV